MNDLRSIAVSSSPPRFWKNLLVYLSGLQFNLCWETPSASVSRSVMFWLIIDISNFPQFYWKYFNFVFIFYNVGFKFLTCSFCWHEVCSSVPVFFRVLITLLLVFFCHFDTKLGFLLKLASAFWLKEQVILQRSHVRIDSAF